MVGALEYKCILSKQDIQLNMINNSFVAVDSKDDVVDNTYYFDSKTNTIYAKSAIGVRGMIAFKLSNLSIGDIIEVETELRSISGSKPFVTITECGADYESAYNDLIKTYYDNNDNNYITVSAKSYIINTTHALVLIGLGRDDAGEYHIRLPRVRVTKKKHFTTPQIMQYSINKYPDGWVLRTDNWASSAGATITEIDANTLKITFDKPFDKRPIPSIAQCFETATDSHKYNAKVGQITVDSIQIKFFDSSNNVVPLANMKNYYYVFLTLIG